MANEIEVNPTPPVAEPAPVAKKPAGPPVGVVLVSFIGAIISFLIWIGLASSGIRMEV